ncbi:MAG: FHA domain-containing protein [Myxococcota bacterium]
MDLTEPYYLIYLNGPLSGQKIALDPKKPELIIGRSAEADIVIDSKNVSRKQAKIKQDVDGVWIEDLGSKNGTLLKDEPINAPTLLQDADEIRLGDLKLGFVDSNAAILKRLSIMPAFQDQNPPETPAPASEEPAAEASAPKPAPVESSPWIDYAYIGLMTLVVIGLMVGAWFWLRG